MTSNKGLRLIFLIFYLIDSTSSADLYDGVADGGQQGNPGVKLRISQKGLDYLNSILLYEMNQIIPRLHLDDMNHEEGQGHIRVTNGRITGYKSPTSQSLTLQPPDQIVWATSGANIAMAGHVQGSYGRFADEGDAEAYANDINFIISIQPLRQSNGQFGARARSCQADIGSLDYNIYNTGAMGKMLQNMKGTLIKHIKPHLAKQMCVQATKFIDQAANDQLASIPTKIPLNESAENLFNKFTDNQDSNHNSQNRNNNNQKNRSNQKNQQQNSDNMFDLPDESDSGDKDAEMQRELTKNITKHLMFDYSNMKDPSVQSRYLETYNKGEISYHGQGGTPFSPTMMHEPGNIPSDKMVYGLASDYVANSMLYNAYSHDLLKSQINGKDTPDFKDYLRTTCGGGDSFFDFCLGSILPEIQNSFPDSQAEINLEAAKSPAIFFRKDGSIDLMGRGLVKLIASKNGQRQTMAIANIDLSAKAKLFLQDNRIKGNCSIDKYEITMKENNLKGFNQQRLNEYKESSRNMMQAIFNVYLKNGLRLPTVKGVKIINPKLNVFERTCRIDADVEADKETLTKMAAAIIKKHGGSVDGY